MANLASVQTGGTTPHLTATFSRPADNTAYTAGDNIANSTTAAEVTPLTFSLPRSSGRLTGCRCVVAPASGNLVITALDFDLLLFRPSTDIPFAAGSYPADNAAMATTAAAMRDLVGVFSFLEGAWRNPAGAVTAGAAGFQWVAHTPATARFNLTGLDDELIGVVQARDAWTPTGIVNRFDFYLDADLD